LLWACPDERESDHRPRDYATGSPNHRRSRRTTMAMRKSTPTACPVCGKTFLPRPASRHHTRQRYCSRACRNRGRLQPSLAERFWKKVNRTSRTGCWIWTGGKTMKGYGMVYARGRQRPASHIAWELHYGPVPEGLWVLHRCDTPPCVRPDHLFVGTIVENMHDASQKGRMNRGERKWNARLTEKIVRAIRSTRLVHRGDQARLARRYGVSDSIVSAARLGVTWKHVAMED
jgi:HNH endonuclease